MSTEAILHELTLLFRELFNDPSLEATPAMTANDVEGWDSLSHVDMIVLVEDHFGIRIPTRRIARLQNVGELADLIDQARRDR